MKRLRKVAAVIESLPIADDIQEEAFQRFFRTGELPDHARLAKALTRRALYAREQEESPGKATAWLEDCRKRVAAIRHSPRPVYGPLAFRPLTLREAVFNEAIHCSDAIRGPARQAIKALVANGGDVTDPALVSDCIGDLGSGTVGEHVLQTRHSDTHQPSGAGPCLLERVRADERTWIHFAHAGEMSDEERTARIQALLEIARTRRASAGTLGVDKKG